ncbi:MAG: hypothetical protein MUF29_08445 [Chitinophagaceae bacterium]|nr:hypothetical protein [Chitinophagaceae bacterium]
MSKIVIALAAGCLVYFMYELVTLENPSKAGYLCLAAGNILALVNSQIRKKPNG